MLKVFTFYGVSTVFVKQVGDYSIYYQSFIFLKKKEGLFIKNDCWYDLIIRDVRYLTSFVHGKSEKDFMFATESYNL